MQRSIMVLVFGLIDTDPTNTNEISCYISIASDYVRHGRIVAP